MTMNKILELTSQISPKYLLAHSVSQSDYVVGDNICYITILAAIYFPCNWKLEQHNSSLEFCCQF